MEKEDIEQKIGHEEAFEGQNDGSHAARFFGRVGPPNLGLEHPLSFGFGVPPVGKWQKGKLPPVSLFHVGPHLYCMK